MFSSLRICNAVYAVETSYIRPVISMIVRWFIQNVAASFTTLEFVDKSLTMFAVLEQWLFKRNKTKSKRKLAMFIKLSWIRD